MSSEKLGGGPWPPWPPRFLRPWSDETCWPCLNTMSEDVGLSFNLLKIFARYRATLLDQQCGPMLASFEQVLTPTKNSLTRVGFELAPMYCRSTHRAIESMGLGGESYRVQVEKIFSPRFNACLGGELSSQSQYENGDL